MFGIVFKIFVLIRYSLILSSTPLANVAFLEKGVFKGETTKSKAGTIIKINGNAYPECRILIEKDPIEKISPTTVGISAYCVKTGSIDNINNSIIPTWECGGIDSDGLKDDFFNKIAYFRTNTIKVDKTIVITNSDRTNHRFKIAYYGNDGRFLNHHYIQ